MGVAKLQVELTVDDWLAVADSMADTIGELEDRMEQDEQSKVQFKRLTSVMMKLVSSFTHINGTETKAEESRLPALPS